MATGERYEAEPVLNHGIKKVLYVLHSFVTTSLQEGHNGYKGTERSAVYTSTELKNRGVDVQVIAAGGSEIPGVEIHFSCDKPHWDFTDPIKPTSASPDTVNQVMDNTINIMNDVVDKWKPDIVDCQIAHNKKMDQALNGLQVPHMVTFNGPTKGREDIREAIAETPDLPVASVSMCQRGDLRANWVGVIPNGIPENLITIHPGPRTNTLVMLARLSPKKDFARGIQIAKKANMQLVIGGTRLNDQSDQEYFDKVLKPLIEKEKATVKLDENVHESNKAEFLSGKVALLALTKREEDEFGPEYIEADGMHITEALAAGIPVIYDSGVDDNKVAPDAGFKCDTVEEAVEALQKIHTIDPQACRRHFVENFTVKKTTDEKMKIYARVKRDFYKGRDLARGTRQCGQ